MKTEQVVKAMLLENTGANLLDSGGAYGRRYDANKKRNFRKEPSATIEFDTNKDGTIYPNVTKSLYHYLVNNLEYAGPMQIKFDRWVEKQPKDTSWFELVEKFPAYLTSKKHEVENIEVVNTYNFDCMLDQVIQSTKINIDGQDYVILMVHGGCDVRGGYTAP